jgi:Type VI secretion system (T6SS), amidase effector protein 4
MSSFQTILSHYPSADLCDAKDAKGKTLFQNQCAIRLSYALKSSGVSFDSFPKQRKCWVHPTDQHVLSARELADWIQRQGASIIQSAEDITGERWRDKVVDRTGILCFEGYYAPEHGSAGDHIDLWNGSSLTGLGSWMRTRFSIVVPGYWSDFRKSRRIRFLSIK